MSESLTPVGYRQTKEKLLKLEQRLRNLDHKSDLDEERRAAARRSYKSMIAQYRRELKLYEAAHPESAAK